MSEIEETFSRLAAQKEGALIAYVTGGYPNPKTTPQIAEALIKGGADMLELGIPFSDPIADGPSIQASSTAALTAGTTPKIVLEIASKIKKKHGVPILIMTYYNPVFRMGVREFMDHAWRSDVDGVVIPDLPVEEADEYKEIAEAYGVDTIFLAAPSTTIERLKRIINYSSGFLYLVSVFGVTGARERILDTTISLVKNFSSYTKGRIPMSVGFGISKPEHVKSIIEAGADGVIVGSAFVNIVSSNLHDFSQLLRELSNYASSLKKASVKRH
ncbi:MAG: tryptophan synthase subunit alpha [Nitrososphaerota archaeon]|nr:tryptophan synthase subunit alpha [Candidatus Bathyarchaeota archaeon]MDW8048440.1 tryptophan synthase subunit alpha [Nitrososphaerota archaeon]